MTARQSLRSRLRDDLARRGVTSDAINGYVLSIDPGPKESFIAIFDGGRLIETGKFVGDDYYLLNASSLNLLLVETPVGWPVRSADGGMALLETAVRVGSLMGHYECKGVKSVPVGSTAWRSTLFGRTNPSDKEVKMYVEGAVDMKANRKIRLNNAHVRDAIAMFLAVDVLVREGRLL